MFAEVVRFSKLEASSANEFRAALTAESVEFLEKLRPGGPWVLTAIVPDGMPTTITAKHRAKREISFGLTTGDLIFTTP